MIGDHTTPPVLKGKTLEEIHRERMAARPDPWTMAWLKEKFDEISKAYLGVCHLINTLVMMCQGLRERVEAQDKRIEFLETEVKLLMARLGEQQVEIGSQVKRMDDMASWASKIEKDVRKFQHKDHSEGGKAK